jgi:hypothetical protein
VGPELMPPYDEKTALERPEGARVQLAARTSSTIMISRGGAAQLDYANLAALIFHELFYAFTRPTYRDPLCVSRHSRSPEDECFAFQDSEPAQNTTGFIFSVELQTRGAAGLSRMARGQLDLPIPADGADPVRLPYLIRPKRPVGTAFFPRGFMITSHGPGGYIWTSNLDPAAPAVSQQIEQYCKPDNPDLPYPIAALRLDLGAAGVSVAPANYLDQDGTHVRLKYGVEGSNAPITEVRLEGVATPQDCQAKVLRAWAELRQVVASFVP